MNARARSLTTYTLAGAVCIGVGVFAVRGMRQDSSAASAALSLAEIQSPIASEFHMLERNLARALQSRDPYALARSGAEVRAFQVPFDTTAAGKSAWRQEKLELWLTAVVGVHQAIDTSFNVTPQPAINVAPMTKTGLALNSGMDPDAITNAVVRDDYLKRLDDNARNVVAHAYQLTVRRLDEEWTEDVQSHVAAQYDLTSEADRAAIEHAILLRITDRQERDRFRVLLLPAHETPAVLASDSGTHAQ